MAACRAPFFGGNGASADPDRLTALLQAKVAAKPGGQGGWGSELQNNSP